MSFTGQPDSPPVRLAPSVLDLTTGMWGLIGIMAALHGARPAAAQSTCDPRCWIPHSR